MLNLTNARLKAKFEKIKLQNFECRCSKTFRNKNIKCKLKFFDEDDIKNAKVCIKGENCKNKER